MVSGSLISGRQYFEALGDTVAEALPQNSEGSKALKEYFSEPAKMYPLPDEEGNIDSVAKTPPTFIHLKNAFIFHNGGNPLPTNKGVLWRGKLTDVSAFFMGSLTRG